MCPIEVSPPTPEEVNELFKNKFDNEPFTSPTSMDALDMSTVADGFMSSPSVRELKEEEMKVETASEVITQAEESKFVSSNESFFTQDDIKIEYVASEPQEEAFIYEHPEVEEGHVEPVVVEPPKVIDPPVVKKETIVLNQTPIIDSTENESFLSPVTVQTDEEVLADYGISPDDLKLKKYQALSSTETMQEKLNSFDEEEYRRLSTQPNSYERQLLFANRDLTFQQSFMQESAASHGDMFKEFKQNSGSLKDGISSKINKVETPDRIVSGKDAKMLAMTKTLGLMRIPLYNSGIYVTMQASSLAEINNFYHSTKISTEYEYGKIFGGFFYLFMDLEIKRKLMDMIHEAIVSCTFREWQIKEEFFKVVSLQDFDSLLWTQSTLMYRDGIDVIFTCGQPNCNYSDTIRMNTQNLRLNNFTVIPQECIDFLTDMSVKDDIQLAKYRENLQFNDHFRVNEHEFYLKIPTWYDYLISGSDFNNSMMKVVQFSNESDVGNFIRYNFYRIYSPWIKKYVNYRDATEIDFAVEDQSAIPEVLTILQTKVNYTPDAEEFETIFEEKITEYMKKTKLSIIAYPFGACPKCNTVPETGHVGLIPYDVQNDFFTLTRMKLGFL